MSNLGLVLLIILIVFLVGGVVSMRANDWLINSSNSRRSCNQPSRLWRSRFLTTSGASPTSK